MTSILKTTILYSQFKNCITFKKRRNFLSIESKEKSSHKVCNSIDIKNDLIKKKFRQFFETEILPSSS